MRSFEWEDEPAMNPFERPDFLFRESSGPATKSEGGNAEACQAVHAPCRKMHIVAGR
jgi:hypothetical protein